MVGVALNMLHTFVVVDAAATAVTVAFVVFVIVFVLVSVTSGNSTPVFSATVAAVDLVGSVVVAAVFVAEVTVAAAKTPSFSPIVVNGVLEVETGGGGVEEVKSDSIWCRTS